MNEDMLKKLLAETSMRSDDDNEETDKESNSLGSEIYDLFSKAYDIEQRREAGSDAGSIPDKSLENPSNWNYMRDSAQPLPDQGKSSSLKDIIDKGNEGFIRDAGPCYWVIRGINQS